MRSEVPELWDSIAMSLVDESRRDLEVERNI
jgi:hypothetical protein